VVVQNTQVVEHLLSGAKNASGLPLSGGSVYTYTAGTTTPKATYTDPYQGTQQSNPISLDQAGCALVFASGLYRFDYYDSDGTLITTRDNLPYNLFGAASFDVGSVTAPSISFSGDSNTGWYWISDGKWGFSANGVLVAVVDVNGLAAVAFTTGV